MSKPKIVIADSDFNYIVPLQQKFVENFFDTVDIEVITEEAYFNSFFSAPQKVDILIVSDSLYSRTLQRHNIAHIFVMSEQHDEDQTDDLNVTRIFKYTNIKEIFNSIVGKSSDVLDIKKSGQNGTQVVLFCSASGGVGKTTIAMGVSAYLTKNYKKVLYINASYLQLFSHLLADNSPVTSDVYSKLAFVGDDVYFNIKHVIRKDAFDYLPPFKAALMSLGLDFSVYKKIIDSAKTSGEYDFIVVDTDTAFDEGKATLLDIADKVVIVTKQNLASVYATNALMSNISGANANKYIFVCNDFDVEKKNALISIDIHPTFSVNEYVEHINECEELSPDSLSTKMEIQKIAFLII